jgi:hypothetical protein
VYITTATSSALGEGSLGVNAAGGVPGQLREVHDLQRRIFQARRQLRNGDDRVDAAVGDHVRDLALAEQEVDRHHAFARDQRPVEAGDEPGARRQQDTHARAVGLHAQVHAQPARHRRQLLIGVLPRVIDDRDVMRLRLRVAEQMFEEHSVSRAYFTTALTGAKRSVTISHDPVGMETREIYLSLTYNTRHGCKTPQTHGSR